jgi:TIR domain
MAPAGPVRAFLSYAHEDHAWRDRVLNQLGWLRHSGQLQAFDDRQIKTGERWDPRIRAELDAAAIIIVLISEHFVGSRFCTIEELVRAVDRQRGGTADLIAIYCDWVDLEALPLAAHQVLPQDEKNDLQPLSAWGEKEASLPLSRIAAAVRRMVEARRPQASEPADGAAPASPPAGIPPRGRFVGRETDLDQLRAWILDDTTQPVAVLGPGGIGKSKLTIAALVDGAIAARFGESRLFVRLEDVRDEAGIYAAVARELGREPGGQPMAAVVAALRGAPALVVLDNAETPWEADLAGAEQAFARLAELPDTSLVVSLRGFELPGVADWRPILIEPLPEHPSRALFLAIAGDRWAADPALLALLARLRPAAGDRAGRPPRPGRARRHDRAAPVGGRAKRLRPPRPGRPQGARPRRLDRPLAHEPAHDRVRPPPVRPARPPAARPRPRRPRGRHARGRQRRRRRADPDRTDPARHRAPAHAGAGARACGR